MKKSFLHIIMWVSALLAAPGLLPGQGTTPSDTQKAAPAALQALVEALSTATDSTESDSEAENALALEIDGLIVDETRTKAGRDFYEIFYAQWVPPPGAQDFNILIREKPGRLRTTIVEIELNELTVFQANLQPRYDIIVQLANAALQRTQAYLANYEQIQQQLGGDDMQGSGIY